MTAHTQLEMEKMWENRWQEIEEVTKDVVKQYRLSKDCYHHKDDYASYFSKFNFYLSCNFLESRCSRDSFSEITFDNAMSIGTPPSWRKYELNNPGPKECIR